MAIHVDIIAELQKRSVAQAATELKQSFDQVDVPIGADVKVVEIKAAAERIKREFSDIRAELKLDVDKNSFGQATRGFKDIENAASGAETALNKVIGSILGLRGPTAIMGGGAAILADGLIQVVQVGTAATQALWLLPAAATAAAAGMGTLALATSGFADTIKDIRDPKKFAADIQMLSPAAQQAALSIQNLLPAFDKLQQATQDALFNGMGEQINRLATTYLPSIQNLTTSIAGSFNNMLTGVANQLMTPETQASMQTMFANITQMFQNLAPAAQPFVKALTDIATVGSGFLPELATSITNAANSFATFIGNARESGQLQVWIQQGIDAVKNLASASWELIQIFYRVFGPETKANIDSNIVGVSALKETVGSYGADLRKISDIIGLVMGDSHTWSVKWNEEMLAMQGPLGSFRDAILDIPEAMATAWNGVKHVIDSMVTNLVNDLNHMADIFPDSVNKALFGTEHPKPFSFTPLPDAPSGGDWGGYQSTQGPFGGPGQPGLGGDPNAQRQRRGAAPVGSGIPGAGPYPGPFGVPPPPPPTGTAKPSDRERLDAIRAGLDPSLYHVDPFAPVPGMPSPGALAGGPMPGGGYGAASGQEFFAGQQEIIAKGHSLEEVRKDRLALERDNQATAEQISDAKWKEYQAEVDLQKAQAALVDKTKGTAQALKTSTEALSAGLDPDLGLSKGLSGFADNLVRFAGHMALAGPMAQLDQVRQQNEQATGITGGYGLLGVQGAQNLSQGLSPLLGNPMANGTGTSTTPPTLGSTVGGIATGGGAAYGLPAGTNTGGYGTGTSAVFPPWVMALAQQYGVTPSTYAGHQESNRNEPGYAPNPQHLNRGIDWTGTPDAMQRFAQAMAADPLAEQVIYNGTSPIEAVAGQARPGYFAGDLAAHGNHVHTRFSQDPTGGLAGGDPAATGYGAGDYSAAGLSGGSIPIPLPVTIVGGGGGGGLGLGGGGGAAPTGGNAWGAASSAATGGLNWDALAQPEAGGNWGNKSNPKYRGGLQFDIPTWNQFRPAGAPDDPADAPKEAQIAAAQNALNSGRTPESLWPQNYGQLSTPMASGAPLAPGGGQGPILPQYQPGIGAGLSNAPTVPGAPGIGGALGTVPPTQYGGVEPPSNPGGGGMGITPGGTIDSAMQMAASAFPGVGQAAATGMKLANRAIQYGGQMAGIGVEGLMQTFLPTGGSELASNSWLTRIVGGLAGASPALPNLAGKQTAAAQQQAQAPLTPQQVTSGGGAPGVGAALGAPITVNYANNGATEDRAGADIAHNLAQIRQPTPVAGHR